MCWINITFQERQLQTRRTQLPPSGDTANEERRAWDHGVASHSAWACEWGGPQREELEANWEGLCPGGSPLPRASPGGFTWRGLDGARRQAGRAEMKHCGWKILSHNQMRRETERRGRLSLSQPNVATCRNDGERSKAAPQLSAWGKRADEPYRQFHNFHTEGLSQAI